jgi:acetate kinase
MGFSPTEGLIMAGRCGDLDPMIPVTLQREGWSAEQLDRLLNHQSGLQGICGVSDMRSILAQAEQGDEAAVLAIDMYCYRIKKYIGAYCAVLGEVSALIFTGGIGEHAPVIREKAVQGLDNLGFSIDPAANRAQAEHNRDIGASDSRSRILVIRAEEEREIARQILELSGQSAR